MHIQELAPSESLSEDLPIEMADFLVLCAADQDYLNAGTAAMKSLRAQFPKAQVLIAGTSPELEALGADHYLFAGMNALLFLHQLTEGYAS